MPASISHSLSVLPLPGTEADSNSNCDKRENMPGHAGISPVCLLHFPGTHTQSWVVLAYLLKTLHAVLVWLYSTFLSAGYEGSFRHSFPHLL